MRLFGILSGAWVGQACYALARFGIADLMAAGPRPAAELAAQSGTDARALHRMLRALAAAGLVSEPSPGSFGLTPVTQPLRSDLPRSSRDAAIMFGEEVFRSFAEIGHTLRTGEPAFDKVYGTSFYDYLSGRPDAARTFATAMDAAGVPAVLSACDLGRPGTLVDVGGGGGALLCHALRGHPAASGILLDLPSAMPQARERVARAGMTGRVEFAEGSFFDRMPEGADVYLLCRVLHNWPDDDALRLLNRIRGAMAAGARLVVFEELTGPGSSDTKVMDLLILLMLSGQDRSEAEYRDLLTRARFTVTAVRPPPRPGRSAESAIEAIAS
jgi:hypothetical protein